MSDLSKDWQDFLEGTLRKGDRNHADPKSLYSIFRDSQLIQDNEGSLLIALPSDKMLKTARGKSERVQKRMPMRWRKPKQLKFCLLPMHPLQSLTLKALDDNERPDPALKAAVETEGNCQELYDQLNERTKMLASSTSIEVEFTSRIRVGGIRGFLDTLLPALHPIYGVPYIPASTLKGITRKWVDKKTEASLGEDIDNIFEAIDLDIYPDALERYEKLQSSLQTVVDCIFGFINQKVDREARDSDRNSNSSLGTVQFLDAFPKEPCLNIDVVTPNWMWNKDREVRYQVAPHAFLTMSRPILVIGLAQTSVGYKSDVELVKFWLREALSQGLGSRISAGYGRVKDWHTTLSNSCTREFRFEMKTQGIYGFDTNQPEFRATAVRGVLRYWFRAIALGIYSKKWSKRLEEDLFGSIESVPRRDHDGPIEGSIKLSTEVQKYAKLGRPKDFEHFEYKGRIYLESDDSNHLEAISKLLELVSHLSGVGRGSRRPLHKNSGRARGCFWQLLGHQRKAEDLESSTESLTGLVEETITLVRMLGGDNAERNPEAVDVGSPGKRKQDVFNESARLFIIPQNGLGTKERGLAMNLLYRTEYKGGKPGNKPSDRGNPHVGGAVGKSSTPSYVTIQTNTPPGESPYEAVTIFDAKSQRTSGEGYKSRKEFCEDLLRIEGAFEIPL